MFGPDTKGDTAMKTIKNYELKIRRVAVAESNTPYGVAITSPDIVEDIARQLIGDAAQEVFLAFLLDVKNRVDMHGIPRAYRKKTSRRLSFMEVFDMCVDRFSVTAHAGAYMQDAAKRKNG